MEEKIQLFFWKILRHSGVFKYWYKRFLNELMYDFDLYDLEGKEIRKKYLKKLKDARKL